MHKSLKHFVVPMKDRNCKRKYHLKWVMLYAFVECHNLACNLINELFQRRVQLITMHYLRFLV